MSVQGDGKVGIGTGSPQQMLSVNTGMNIDQASGNSGTVSSNALTFGNGSGEGIASNRNSGVNQYGLDFYTDYINRLAITNGGNVGIGTPTPGSTLTVNGTTTTTNFQMTNGGTNGYVLQSDASGNGTWVSPSSVASNNIYNSDGTLTGNRTVTQGSDNINFNATSGNFNYNTSGNGSVAMGNNVTASGNNSFATGLNNNTTGNQSFVSGASNNVSGNYALVNGNSNTVSAPYSMVSGLSNQDYGTDDIVGGFENVVYTGYGHTIAIGYQDSAIASAGAVFGFLNKISAFEAFATGDRNVASGQSSAVFGGSNTAAGASSFVTGYGNTANGSQGFTSGIGNTSESWSEMAVGTFGTTYTPSSTTGYVATDRVFNIGNGSSSSARSDAFTVLKNGNVGIGTASPAYRLDVKGQVQATSIGGGSAASFISTSSANNGYAWNSTSGGTDGKWWDMIVINNGALLEGRAVNDANSSATQWLNVFRGTGTSITSVDFPTGNVGIGTTSPGSTLTVNGTTTTTNFEMTNGASNGYILKSDASGNASWVAPSSITTATTNTLTNPTNTITSTVNGVVATAPAVNTVGSVTTANTASITVNGVASSPFNIINSNTKTWTQAGGLSDVVNGVSANVTPASGTITNTLGYNSSGAPVYQATSAMTHGISNTISGNTISTTVDGTTGTAVTVPNIYTANGTLTGARTVTMGANALNFSSTGGSFGVSLSGGATASIGSSNTTSGTGSMAIGSSTTASGVASLTMGTGTTAPSYDEMAVGSYNTTYTPVSSTTWQGTDRLFGIGNGTGSGATSDALVVLKDGAIGVGISTPISQFANTSTNIIGNDAQGVNTNSLTWAQNASGYTMAVYNTSTGTHADGLAVKLAATASTNRLLDLSTGVQNAAGTSVMVVQANGQVGIGNSSPVAILDVNTPTTGTFVMPAHFFASSNTGGGNVTQIRVGTAASNYNSTELRLVNGISTAYNVAQLGLYGTTGITVNASGYLGVGTASPGATLDVAGTARVGSPGTIFKAMQAGQATIGAQNQDYQYTLTFPNAFANAPKVIATCQTQTGQTYTDNFSIVVQSVSTTSCILRIHRTDSGTAWGQSLLVNWFAFDN